MPGMIARDETLRTHMSRCAESMASARRDVSAKLLSLSSTQTRIREMSKKMSVLKTMMGYQQTMMGSLGFVRHMPASYVASIAEVVRRRAFANLYTSKVEQLAEQVAKLRESELRKRERFLREHAKFMPETLINTMGLSEWQLPLCEIILKPFDEGLPNLTRKDVVVARTMLSSPAVDGVFQEMEMDGDSNSKSDSSGGGSSSGGRGALLLGAAATSAASTNILELENAALRAEIEVLRGSSSGVDPSSSAGSGTGTSGSATYDGAASRIVKTLSEEVDGYKKRIVELEEQLNAQSKSG